MPNQTFLYFAYGSNMLTERLIAPKRCPSARPLGVAQAADHVVTFCKKAPDGSGKAGLVPQKGNLQYGVLFEINSAELFALDREEGVGNGYARADGFIVKRMDTGEAVSVVTYLPTHPEPGLTPFDWYYDLVLTGARQHNLPPAQINQLTATPFIADKDETRISRIDGLAALATAQHRAAALPQK